MDRSDEGNAEAARSSFIVYVDESGDHSLDKIDDAYPVFVLAFCVFYQENYVNNVVSAVERLKFQKFGHDIVILHERDIRKEIEPFKFKSKTEKERFIGDLTQIIADSKFILIAALIDKRRLKNDSDLPENAYHIASGSCLEGLGELLAEKEQQDRETHVVFERRGAKEDKELELEFRRICDGANPSRTKLPYRIVLADKKVLDREVVLLSVPVHKCCCGKHVLLDRSHRTISLYRRGKDSFRMIIYAIPAQFVVQRPENCIQCAAQIS